MVSPEFPDRGEIDFEPLGVVEPQLPVRADVEEHRVGLGAAPAAEEHREPVAGAAELIEGHLALVPIVDMSGKSTRAIGDFANLRQPLVHAEEPISLVVDDDPQVERV